MNIYERLKKLIPNKAREKVNSEERILVYDKIGNQYTIPKSHWVNDVLPKEIKKDK